MAEEYAATGNVIGKDENWMNSVWACTNKLKFNLFNRYGYIAAAGDRHLAEFCEGKWYLESPEKAREWGFNLTPVSFRRNALVERLERSERLKNGEEKPEIKLTGEEGVHQMCALLGLGDIVTNVNILPTIY